MGGTQSQRKQYLINPGFQWKIAGTIAAGVFFFSLIISVTLYATLHQQARLRAADPAHYVAPVTSVMVCFAMGFAALTAGGVGLWSILMTHRICGPMFVMKRYLLELAQGRLPALRPLRKRDEFKDLYEAFDQAISTLRAGKQRELMQLGTVLEAARQAQSQGEDAMRLQIEAMLERLVWLRDRAQEALSEIKPQKTESQGQAVAPVAHFPV